MPFEIIRNDIVNMKVDAIVNTANPRPVIGSGTDAAIHAKAGPMLLLARKAVGNIPTGEARITPAFRLNAKYVIHTVGPVWRGGGYGEAELLRQCYDNSLALARKKGLSSIAFPLISTGNYGFPKALALRVASDAVRDFLREQDMQIYLVVFSRESFELSAGLTANIRSFIDENYVQEKAAREYSFTTHPDYEPVRRAFEEAKAAPPKQCSPMPRFRNRPSRRESVEEYLPMDSEPGDFAPEAASLSGVMEELDAGFSETLLKLIDQTGKKDAEIYRKANVSRQHFSKIRNNPAYQPTKATALAFAVALELDLEQTKDLIGRAGYALTKSSRFDLIVMYFIRERNYNMFDINAALFEFDQSLLGAK